MDEKYFCRFSTWAAAETPAPSSVRSLPGTRWLRDGLRQGGFPLRGEEGWWSILFFVVAETFTHSLKLTLICFWGSANHLLIKKNILTKGFLFYIKRSNHLSQTFECRLVADSGISRSGNITLLSFVWTLLHNLLYWGFFGDKQMSPNPASIISKAPSNAHGMVFKTHWWQWKKCSEMTHNATLSQFQENKF